MGNSQQKSYNIYEDDIFSGNLQSGSIPRESETYSVLPVELVIDLVANLNLSKLKILSRLWRKKGEPFLYTISFLKKDYMNYVISESSHDKIRFYGVNYQDTLLNCWVLDTVDTLTCSTIRGNIIMHWRGEPYSVSLPLPKKCASFEIAKSAILTLFNLPSLTFIICNSVVHHFTKMNDKFFLSFMATLKDGKLEANTEWDFANNTIIGKISGNIVYLINDSICVLSNQYPDIGSQKKQRVVIGDGFNYFLQDNESSDCMDSNSINPVTYVYPTSFVSPEVKGELLTSLYFKNVLPIDNSKFYFIGIVNPLKEEQETGQFHYAILGSSSFQDTSTTNRTTPLPIDYVKDKDNSFQQVGTLFFKFAKTKMLIYRDGLSEFLKEYKANQLLSNIVLYDSTTMKYDAIKNSLVPKVPPPVIKEKAPMNSKAENYYSKAPMFTERDFVQQISPVLLYFGKPYGY